MLLHRGMNYNREFLSVSSINSWFYQRKRKILLYTQANRQMKNQRKLMAEQLEIDKLKMEEQRRIQLQMWKDTNYAAQVEEIKKAGLSIGLMYGKGAAGGTTTGAGATGVNAPSAPTGMGLLGGSQLAVQMANIELTKAQTENVKADTERKLGVDKTKVEAETNSIIQGKRNL